MIPQLLLSILLALGPPADEGTVTGTLRLHDGLPASGIRVGVMIPPGEGRAAPRGAGTLMMQSQSDDSGKYRIEGVPTGRYYVVAGKLDSPTYYPGVRVYTDAKLIVVGAKATVSEINFEVDSTRLVDAPSAGDPNVIPVKGHVVLKGDLNSPHPVVSFEVAGPNGRAVTTPLVAADGTFTLSLKLGDQVVSLLALPDGYTLASMTSGSKDVRSQPLHVAAGTELVVTLNAEARPRFRVVARVIDNLTETSLVGETVELIPQTGETVRSTVNAQGMVTFSNLFSGTYTLRVISPRLEPLEKRITITNTSLSVELRASDKR